MRTAADLLGRRDSAELRARLLPVRPDEVPVREAPRWLVLLWPSWVAGMALPRVIFVRASLLTAEAGGTCAAVVAHELVHIGQWRRHGPLAFLFRYLGDYLRGRAAGLGHRGAYRSVRFEVEARLLSR